MNLTARKYLMEIRAIFFYTVVCVYSWLLLIFFWDLPGFMFYLSGWEIISYLAYQFTFALWESVIFTIAASIIAHVFLSKKHPQNIIAAGALLILSFAISSILFKEIATIAQWLIQTFGIDGFKAVQISASLWAVSMLSLPILSLRLARENKVSHFINNTVENLSVLVSLYVTISLISIALVIYRNI